MYELDAAFLRDVQRSSAVEWIETNGVGGWAGSTVSFICTRRYHGMLVAAGATERRVVVAKLDETIAGTDLGANFFPGAVHPRGFEHLQSFRKDVFPQWTYEVAGIRLRKTIVAPHGENTTIVLYEVLEAREAFEMRLAPFLAGRGYHALRRAGDPPRDPVHFDVPAARFEEAPSWWRDFVYPREAERGLDSVEDLWTPGAYVVTLHPGATLPVVIAETQRERDAMEMIERERARREAIVVDTDRDLSLAADQFLVECGGHAAAMADPEERRHGRRTPETIIAGYHWFTDWGRDTMISLPGLCLSTGRFADAKAILRRWLAAMSRGMLPCRFPDGTTEPSFNAVDSTLWLFVTTWRYLHATGDVDFVRDEVAPKLREAIDAHLHGTRFNIHVDDDGLLFAGAGGVALTWMDAIVDGTPVTPRRGKAVEINALWYNALRIAAEICDEPSFAERAAETKRAFESAFWNEATGCCFDVLNPADAAVRPNQLFALALPFPLFDDERAQSILAVVDAKLLTPVGLRTLAPDEHGYCGRMVGSVAERDYAYHQGTVWPWLMGAYADAALRIRGPRALPIVDMLLDAMHRHMTENCIGTISEVFDAEAPHAPRGCVAQAWSVAEVMRVETWRRKLNA